MAERSRRHAGSEAPARTVHLSLHRGAERRDSTDLADVRRTLWAVADPLRANFTLAPSVYRGPVLGLIFLAYAEHRFDQARPELVPEAEGHGVGILAAAGTATKAQRTAVIDFRAPIGRGPRDSTPAQYLPCIT